MQTFASLPIGSAFQFLGNPIQFYKHTDFKAEGYRAYNEGGSFLVSVIDKEFCTSSLVIVLEKIDITKEPQIKV